MFLFLIILSLVMVIVIFQREERKEEEVNKLYFYNTSDKKMNNVYQDREHKFCYPNPIILDSSGSVEPLYFNSDEPYSLSLTGINSEGNETQN